MSTTADVQPGSPRTEPPATADSLCAQCASPMAEDQEWCLECGSARTLIHSPPDWRVPVAIIGAVVLLVLAGFATALVSLSSTANDNTQTVNAGPVGTAPASRPATTGGTPAAATSKPAAAAKPAPPIANWPVGLSGWTVVLFKSHEQATAVAHASRAAAAGLSVGVLNSTQHPNLAPGDWIVFSGRYPDQAHAEAAATSLRARGHRRARARAVAGPGGL